MITAVVLATVFAVRREMQHLGNCLLSSTENLLCLLQSFDFSLASLLTDLKVFQDVVTIFMKTCLVLGKILKVRHGHFECLLCLDLFLLGLGLLFGFRDYCSLQFTHGFIGISNKRFIRS